MMGKKFQQLMCIGVSIASLSVPAIAQQTQASGGANPAAADETGKLSPSNEIVVSARRREESVQDVPQTVNVVTAAQVEKLNLRNFTDIQSIVPGLTLNANSSFSNRATVRGVDYVPEASGVNPSVEFYLNDAPIASGFLFQSTYDFGQFELQRGPQGTLRGRASPSGSIAVTVRRPDLAEVGAVFNGTLTDRHARKVDGAFNIPIIQDVLAVRLAGVVDNDRGGYIRTIKEQTSPEFNEPTYRRTRSLRASVRFEPTDWARFNVMYQTLRNRGHRLDQVASNSLFVTGAPQTTPLIRPFDRLSNEDQGTYDRQDQEVYIANADISFAGQRLSYVGSYTKQIFGTIGSSDAGDFYGNPSRIPLAPRAFADPAGAEPVCQTGAREFELTPTTGAFFQCTQGRATSQSHEIRLASEERIAGIFDYVVGGLYLKFRSGNQLTQETPLVINPVPGFFTFLPPAFGGPVVLTPITTAGGLVEKSAFGNVTAHFLDDKLEISGGLRYIDLKDQPSGITVSGFPIYDPAPIKSNATVYLASIKYKVTPDLMVYATTGSSYRAGANAPGNFSLLLSPREQQFIQLSPERSKSYEIGAKLSFLDGRGRLNLSAYQQDFKNYPFRGPAVLYQNFTFNQATGTVSPQIASFNFIAAVPVKVKGIEGEASFQISDRWNIGLNASYTDGRIKNGTIACTDLDRNGVPDTNPATPATVVGLNLDPGQNVNVCSGINQRSNTSAKFNANIQSEFGLPLSDTMDGFVRGLATITGKNINEQDNLFDNTGAYGLLNLFAGVRDPDGAWEVTVFGKNILRERQILSVGAAPRATTFATGLPTFTSEYRTVSVTAPREFGVNLRIALGSR